MKNDIRFKVDDIAGVVNVDCDAGLCDERWGSYSGGFEHMPQPVLIPSSQRSASVSGRKLTKNSLLLMIGLLEAESCMTTVRAKR